MVRLCPCDQRRLKQRKSRTRLENVKRKIDLLRPFRVALGSVRVPDPELLQPAFLDLDVRRQFVPRGQVEPEDGVQVERVVRHEARRVGWSRLGLRG